MPLYLHVAAGWILVIAVLALVGFWVPPADVQIGESYLIFFFHFPSAFNCLLFFLIAGAFAVHHLAVGARRGSLGSDYWSAGAVEVGLLGCTIALVTGSIWAKAAWGVWWNFSDPRLMSVAIMWFTYAGYLAFRAAVDEPEKRARYAAVFAVIAAVNVPLVYFSIRIFGKVRHPMKIELGETSMVVTRWCGAAAFFVVYTAFLRLRKGIHKARNEVERLAETVYRAGW